MHASYYLYPKPHCIDCEAVKVASDDVCDKPGVLSVSDVRNPNRIIQRVCIWAYVDIA